ncbi:MAG: hypothetical protein G01um1014107_125 [Parcubacteria group bacterium Gr01-1014_107]|nr:MAG: hypothetical protein G01um1014107_125 [Parcubacteria group bacterium Gr01-1014_107]
MTESSQGRININISTGSVFKVLLIVLFIAGLFFLRDLVLVVLTAVLIASAIEPATKWFGRHRIPRLLAVLWVYLGGALVLAATFYFLLIPLIGEAASFLQTLPEHLVIPEAWNPLGSLSEPLFGDLSKGFSIQEFLDRVNVVLSGTFNFLGAVSTFFGGIFSLALIVVLSFYLAVQENGVAKFLQLVSPVKYEHYVLDLWRRAEIKIGLWMQGQIVLAVIIGVLTYLGLVLLGIPNALLLAFLAAVLELIPVFGPIIAAVPAVILGFVDGGLTLALVVAGFYVIIQQFESQLIYPLVVRKVVGISPIVVILALIVGFRLAGFLGILLSVPLATIMLIFFEDLEQRKRSRTAIDA